MADALGAVVRALGAPSADAVVLVHERWPDLVGGEVAAHARPVGIVDGRLRVVADGPGWASHLRWAEAEVLAAIGALVGPGAVTSVTVSVERRRPSAR